MLLRHPTTMCHAFVYSSNGKRCASTGAQIVTAEHIVIAEKPFGTELRKIIKKAVKRILFVYTCVAKLIQFDLDYSTLTPPAQWRYRCANLDAAR